MVSNEIKKNQKTINTLTGSISVIENIKTVKKKKTTNLHNIPQQHMLILTCWFEKRTFETEEQHAYIHVISLGRKRSQRSCIFDWKQANVTRWIHGWWKRESMRINRGLPTMCYGNIVNVVKECCDLKMLWIMFYFKQNLRLELSILIKWSICGEASYKLWQPTYYKNKPPIVVYSFELLIAEKMCFTYI